MGFSLENITNGSSTISGMDEDAKRVISNAFRLVALSMIPAIAGGFLGAAMHTGLLGFILAFVLSLVVLFAIHKNKDSASAVWLMFLFTGLTGFSIGESMGMLVHAGHAKTIGLAAVTSTGLFAALSVYAANTKRDFSMMGGFLFTGLITMIVLGIANIFLQLPVLSLALAGAGVVLFSLFTIYDVNRAVQGGETNYVILAVNLWLDLYNLFLDILRILISLRD